MKSRPTFRGVVLRRSPKSGVSVPPSGPSAPPQVRVAREVSGRNGKAVTVITGLPPDPAGLDALAARLKKLCGAGGAVKGGAVEIQGEHRDRIVAELQRLGHAPRRAGG